MLRLSRRMNPGALDGHDDARTWVWSDLHLGHTKTIEAFGRPFGTPDEMNDKLFRNWEQVVASTDTILSLGDVTVNGLWGSAAQPGAWRTGAKDPRVREPRDHPRRRARGRWLRRSAQQLVRGRRAAPTADARATSNRPRRLREHSRPSTPQTVAGEDEAHQRQRRAAPVPAKSPRHAPQARPAPRQGRDRARAHDSRPTELDRLKGTSLSLARWTDRRRKRDLYSSQLWDLMGDPETPATVKPGVSAFYKRPRYSGDEPGSRSDKTM